MAKPARHTESLQGQSRLLDAIVQVDFELTEEGLLAVLGFGKYNPSHQLGARNAHKDLWPVRLLLAYLRHLRDHGLEEWRWQELKAMSQRAFRCLPSLPSVAAVAPVWLALRSYLLTQWPAERCVCGRLHGCTLHQSFCVM